MILDEAHWCIAASGNMYYNPPHNVVNAHIRIQNIRRDGKYRISFYATQECDYFNQFFEKFSFSTAQEAKQFILDTLSKIEKLRAFA